MILNLTDYHVGYPGRPPLIKSLHLQLKRGDRVIVFGANGSGKSTLLKSLVKMTTPQWSLSPEKILYASQDHALNTKTPDTTFDYLIKSLLLLRPFTPQKAVLKAVEEICLRFLLKNEPIAHLSGGQKQKLKLARAFLNQSEVLLLDEPFNSVDWQCKMEMISWLNEIQPSTLQILVLHDLFEIEKLRAPILWIQNEQARLLPFEDWFKGMDRIFHQHHEASAPNRSLDWN